MRDLFNLVDACSSKITFTHMYVICYWQLISFDDIITNAKTIKSYSWFARHDGPFCLIFSLLSLSSFHFMLAEEQNENHYKI